MLALLFAFLYCLFIFWPLDSLSPFGSMLNVSIQHRWVPCKCHWHLHCFANGKRLRRLSDRQCRETSRKRSFHSAALSFLRLAASAAGGARLRHSHGFAVLGRLASRDNLVFLAVLANIRPLGQAVKTSPSHGEIGSSILPGVTICLLANRE